VPVDVGIGPVVVVLPGFALSPAVYRRTAILLAERCRVIVPELYRVNTAWRYADILQRFTATLDLLALDRVTIIGHSFAGSVELGFAARYPERVVELIFADTLAVSREMPLAEEALRHPGRLLWLATPRAAASFAATVLTHPRQVVEAAWFGFTSGRSTDAERVAAAGLPAHVLWASRDSLLRREDGRAFARELHASFTVVQAPDGKPVDHDWMYRHPGLFVSCVEQLGLVALRDEHGLPGA
jgi:pimeloyl-ACP methyl ester carboxylesterase